MWLMNIIDELFRILIRSSFVLVLFLINFVDSVMISGRINIHNVLKIKQ